MKKNFIRKALEGLALGCALTFALGSTLFSCADITSSASDLNQPSSIEYGSLSICDGLAESARALDISTLTSATVTVSGYGMSDITKTDVSITNGAASASIENIPVGNNRVVTVKSNVDGATLRAVCDIKGGENTVTINWSTTALGNVFYNLIKKGTNVAEIAKTAFDSAIDSTVHASLIDAEAIAAAYPSLGDASSYVTNYGTVSVKASNASGYTVQITDIASEKVTIDSASLNCELKAYPGTWKVWVLDSSGTKVAEKDITVLADDTSTVEVKYNDPSNFDGIQIQVAKSLNYPMIHYWDCSDSSTYANTTWPGINMLADWSDDDYIYNFNGCSAVSLLITNSSAAKLCSNNITISSKGSYRITASGSSSSEYISNGNSEASITLTVNSPVPPADAVKIYVSASSAPSIWVWQPDGLESTKLMGYTWNSQPTMSAATGLKYNSGWYVLEIGGEYYTEGKAFSFILNSGSTTMTSTKTTTFWYDAAGLCGSAGTYYD
ncbi:MAG: hypothetical protein IJ727_00165 [Treponema sp.]|nr:hypothetical protein [Treponema sp.]